VRRPHLDENDLLVSDLELELAFEDAVGEREVDVREIEMPQARKRERRRIGKKGDPVDAHGVERLANQLSGRPKGTDDRHGSQQEVIATRSAFSQVFDAAGRSDRRSSTQPGVPMISASATSEFP